MPLGAGFLIRLRALEARLGLRLDPAVRATARMTKACDDLGAKFEAAGGDAKATVDAALDAMLSQIEADLARRGELPAEGDGGPEERDPALLAEAAREAWEAWSGLCDKLNLDPRAEFDDWVFDAAGVDLTTGAMIGGST